MGPSISRIVHCQQYTWVSIRNDTYTIPISHMMSQTSHKPSPAILTFLINKANAKGNT
ncbi:hypothetical protein Syun_021544 [Stephania yunnanensis]|uniref:Uncharacterized protein n=1 Tax=Stephania yunnanensis TaxID=152371 RepID=A0AAP0IG73_9MAGN